MNTTDVAPAIPVRKKRRWWFYALLVAGGLLLLAISLFLAGLAYGRSLIRTYAANQPVSLPQVDASPAVRQELMTRWTTFQKAVEAGQAVPPLKLSADDLNVFLANLGGLSNRFHVIISGDKLQGQFSVPLGEKKGPSKLKGKFLNGIVTFAVSVGGDGFPVLRVAKAEVNDKPAPGWILKQTQKRNLLENVDRNRDFSLLLQNIDDIEVKDDLVVITPHRVP